MDERRTDAEAAAINALMAQQIALRRETQPERRQGRVAVVNERRRICAFCFQPGDHQTAAQCLRALERATSD